MDDVAADGEARTFSLRSPYSAVRARGAPRLAMPLGGQRGLGRDLPPRQPVRLTIASQEEVGREGEIRP